MSYGSYNQYDSRWGKKNYNGSSNMSTSGCGPTSCANILHNIKSSITPITTMKYMQSHGYAIRNQGTAHNGIPACLKHFGAKDVEQRDAMTDIWADLKKGYAAIFLMVYKKGLGSPTWTTDGHFIAIVGYKYKNKKHYVKVEDSGGRGHDGWYCYETQMKGWIRKAWTCLAEKEVIKPVKKPGGKFSGKLPVSTIKNGSKGDNVLRWQKFINWYLGSKKLRTDGEFGHNTEHYTKIFQTTEGLSVDGVVGEKTRNKAKTYFPSEENESEKPKDPNPVKKTKVQKLIKKMDEYSWEFGTPKSKYSYKTGRPRNACKEAMAKHGYKSKEKLSSCVYFANTLIRDSGINKSFCAGHGYDKPYPKHEKGLDIVISGRVPKVKELKPGDMIRYKKTNKDEHVMFYYGHNRICDAGHYNRFGNIRKNDFRYKRKNVKKNTIQVLRVKE